MEEGDEDHQRLRSFGKPASPPFHRAAAGTFKITKEPAWFNVNKREPRAPVKLERAVLFAQGHAERPGHGPR